MKIQIMTLAVSLIVSNVALANVDKKQNKDIRANSRDISKLEKVNNRQDKKIDRVDSASKKRDEKLNDRIVRFDSNSKKRDDRQNVRIARNTNRINALGEDISHLRSDMYSAVAGVAAMGAIPQASVGLTAIGFGYGSFGGTEATAFGISHRTENGKHAFTLSGTFTEREDGIAIGYSYSF